MKKISIIVVAIVSFLLVGCSNGNKKIDENKESSKSDVVMNKNLSENGNEK